VLVASLSTIIGYGVLLISDSLTLASFGSLAILGEATCLLSALLLLPAVNVMMDRRDAQRAGTPLGVPRPVGPSYSDTAVHR
jgi:predicted RND superfamily exporter protein